MKTYLPLFSGFYGTIWELDTELTDENNKEINFDRLQIDYDKYNRDVCLHIIDELNDELNFLDVKITFENIVSPKFYNFENDSCNVDIEVNTKKLQAYLNTNHVQLAEYIKDRYTSRDGFTSYHFNDVNEWIFETENFTKFDDEHKLGSLLEFVCQLELITEDSIYQRFDYNTYEYIEVLDHTWDNVDIDQVFIENIDSLNFEFGYIKFEVDEAKKRAELFGTNWIDELFTLQKISLLEAAGFEAMNFEYSFYQ